MRLGNGKRTDFLSKFGLSTNHGPGDLGRRIIRDSGRGRKRCRFGGSVDVETAWLLLEGGRAVRDNVRARSEDIKMSRVT